MKDQILGTASFEMSFGTEYDGVEYHASATIDELNDYMKRNGVDKIEVVLHEFQDGTRAVCGKTDEDNYFELDKLNYINSQSVTNNMPKPMNL